MEIKMNKEIRDYMESHGFERLINQVWVDIM